MSAIKYVPVFILSFLLTAFQVKAQQEYFVYLQTENQKPFYAKLENKVISSTASGYLILPKMQEGRYLITIGFPRNEFPEEQFSVEVKEKNTGYLLKQLNDENFSLFNLQSLAVVNALKGDHEQTQTVATVKDDPFTTMLAKATKDPTLLKSEKKEAVAPVAKKDEIEAAAGKEGQSVIALHTVEAEKKEQTTEKQDVVSAEKQALISGEEQEEVTEYAKEEGSKVGEGAVAAQESSAKNAEIKRILYVAGRDGKEMVYVDESGTGSDTVRVFIPQTAVANKSHSVITVRENQQEIIPKAQMEQEEPVYTITPTVVPKEEPKKQSVIIFEDKPAKQEDKLEVVSGGEKAVEKKVEGELIVLPPTAGEVKNSNCKNVAGDKDFLRIRRRMAVERTREGMIEAARKVFKNVCFSTEQIRNLSFMFLDDEGRYMFFDAAYAYTSDPERYETLVSLLNDDYYVNRFKAMIQK